MGFFFLLLIFALFFFNKKKYIKNPSEYFYSKLWFQGDTLCLVLHHVPGCHLNICNFGENASETEPNCSLFSHEFHLLFYFMGLKWATRLHCPSSVGCAFCDICPTALVYYPKKRNIYTQVTLHHFAISASWTSTVTLSIHLCVLEMPLS